LRQITNWASRQGELERERERERERESERERERERLVRPPEIATMGESINKRISKM
jgi:hypothetical protein